MCWMTPHRVTVLKDQGCPPGLGLCTPLPEAPPHRMCTSGASCSRGWEPLRAILGSSLSWPPPPSGGLSPSNRSPCLDFGLLSAKERGGRRRAGGRAVHSCSFPTGPTACRAVSTPAALAQVVAAPLPRPLSPSWARLALSTPVHSALSFNSCALHGPTSSSRTAGPAPEQGREASDIRLLASRALVSLPGRHPGLQSLSNGHKACQR